MDDRNLNESSLLARFDLIGIDGEGLLLDRESGAVYRLNPTGYGIWASMVAGKTIASITADLIQRFGLPQKQAERDVSAVLSAFPEVPLSPPVDQHRWSTTPYGYGFFERDLLLCEVSADGDSLHLNKDLRPTERQAWIYMKSVVPKVLALRGATVLHASAVDVGGGLLVFVGRSGAGKTTSAKAFAAAGGFMVSEDLLVVGSTSPKPAVVIGGESAVLAWVSASGRKIAAHPDEPIDCTALDRCYSGDRLPIGQILLLNAERRSGDRITIKSLPKADALVALIESIYFGSDAANTWHSVLGALKDIAGKTAIAEAIMPAGTTEIGNAARRFLLQGYDGVVARGLGRT